MSQRISGLSIGMDLETLGIERSVAQIKSSFREVKSAARVNLSNIKFDTKSVDSYKKNLSQLTTTFKAQEKNVDALRKKLDLLDETGEGNTEQAKRLRTEYNRQQEELNRLGREIHNTTEELKKMEQAQKGSRWTEAGESMEKFGQGLKTAGESVKQVGSNLTKSITVPLAAMGTGAIKSSIDFESAFAGVKKTVDMSESGFEQLSNSIRDMAKELPFAATEISEVAESAGQLGIENENILSFTRTIMEIGVATNMTTEQAATDFARFANIIQMPQENFDKLGSSIVALGNNFATTESEIMSLSMGLAGISQQVGITEAETLALATAMSSVGIQAEGGASAMTAVMKKMQNAISEGGAELDLFAQASGMSAEEFASTWESSPIEAFDGFIKGLAASGESGENLNAILGDLGIKGIRETDTLLRMTGASGLLSEAVDISTRAWEENTALTEEAQERYKTMESQIQVLKNKLIDLGIEIGQILMPILSNLMDRFSKLIDWFSELNKKTQEKIVNWALIAAAIGPVILILGNLMSSIGSIILPISKLITIIGGAGGLKAALGVLGTKVISVLAILGPWSAVIGGVILASVGLVKHFSQEAIPAINDFGDEVSDTTTEAVNDFMSLSNGATSELDRLFYSGEIITADGSAELTRLFGEMFETIKTSMAESFEEDKQILGSFFEESNAMSIGHERAIMENINTAYEERLEKINENEAEINRIKQEAMDEGRELTQSELSIIERINRESQEMAIEELSESEQEQLIIKEMMSQEKGAIDARSAAETVQRSKEAKEGVIKEATETYEKRIAAIAYQRDVTGSISADEAAVLIADAEKIRDESIAAADKTHKDVVDAAQKQASEHIDAVDWETGEVLSKWDQTKKTLAENWAGMTEGWSEFWGGNREGMIKHHEEEKKERDRANKEASKQMSEWWEGYKTRRSEQWDEMTSGFGEFWSGLVSGYKEYNAKQTSEREKNHAETAKSFSDAWTSLTTNLSTWWNNIFNNFKSWLDNKITEFNKFRTNLTNFFSQLWTTLTTNLSTWWNNILNNFKSWLNNKITEFNKFRTNLTNFFTQLWKNLTTNLSTWWENIRRNFQTWLNNKITAVSNFGKNIGSAFSGIWTTVTNSMQTAWNNIKSRFDTFLSNLVSGARGIGTGLRNAFASAFNTGMKAVTSGVNKIISGINWVLKRLSVSKEISPWTVTPIPMYKKGTDGHPEDGPAIVNDGPGKNFREAFMTPDGRTGVFPDQRNMLVNLPKGTSVLPGEKTKDLMDQLNVPKYASGIGDGINQIWEWVSGGAKNLLDKAIGLFGSEPKSTGSTIWGDVAKGAFRTVKDAAVGFIDSQISNLFSFGGVNFGSGFTLTSRFGPRWGRLHEGLDYAAAMGTPIPAQTGGRVTQSRYHPTYGNFVEVTSGGVQYRYAHNSKNLVAKGDTVTAGQILGLVGSTGRSTGPHVHFEIRVGGKAVDPLTFSGAGGGGFSGSSGMNQWTAVASQALQMTGQYSPANLSRLLMQMKTESGGNARAINNWDSNARRGTPSKGLMQVIDPTFNAYKMPGYNNIWNPLDNILASIRYSLSRYGSLSSAWRGVGYATGGLINQEGLYQLAEEGFPEFVIPTDPARKTDAMKLLALANQKIQGKSNKRPNDLIGPSSSTQEQERSSDVFNIYITANGDLPASTIRKMADKIEEEIKKKQDRRKMAKGEGVSFI